MKKKKLQVTSNEDCIDKKLKKSKLFKTQKKINYQQQRNHQQEKKIISDKLAVCGICGYLSEDFSKCLRCKRTLPGNVKFVPVLNNKSFDAKLQNTQMRKKKLQDTSDEDDSDTELFETETVVSGSVTFCGTCGSLAEDSKCKRCDRLELLNNKRFNAKLQNAQMRKKKLQNTSAEDDNHKKMKRSKLFETSAEENESSTEESPIKEKILKSPIKASTKSNSKDFIEQKNVSLKPDIC